MGGRAGLGEANMHLFIVWEVEVTSWRLKRPRCPLSPNHNRGGKNWVLRRHLSSGGPSRGLLALWMKLAPMSAFICKLPTCIADCVFFPVLYYIQVLILLLILLIYTWHLDSIAVYYCPAPAYSVRYKVNMENRSMGSIIKVFLIFKISNRF